MLKRETGNRENKTVEETVASRLGHEMITSFCFSCYKTAQNRRFNYSNGGDLTTSSKNNGNGGENKVRTEAFRDSLFHLPTEQIDDIKFRPPIFKVKILIFKYR